VRIVTPENIQLQLERLVEDFADINEKTLGDPVRLEIGLHLYGAVEDLAHSIARDIRYADLQKAIAETEAALRINSRGDKK